MGKHGIRLELQLEKSICSIAIVLLLLGLNACSVFKSGGGNDEESVLGKEYDPAELDPLSLDPGEKLRVAVTTNILGDVVSNIGGDQIELTILMGIGEDPHSYVLNPADIAAVHDAHVVFIVGAGLEIDLEEMFNSAGGEAVFIQASQGVKIMTMDNLTGNENPVEGSSGLGDKEEHHYRDEDPHVWFSVPNVIIWVNNVLQTLMALDPVNKGLYENNSMQYVEELNDLDAWVFDQVAILPVENRLLVTNHPTFGYFANRYGFDQVGVIYLLNPASEPSAQNIVILEEAIREYNVSAVFTESTVNPRLANQISVDTGVKLIQLYTGSLGEPGSGAETYVDLIRFDVDAIVEGLSQPQ